MSELNLEGNTTIDFPEGRDKLTSFYIIFSPVDGIYAGGTYTFSFNVGAAYPHEPPKVMPCMRPPGDGRLPRALETPPYPPRPRPNAPSLGLLVDSRPLAVAGQVLDQGVSPEHRPGGQRVPEHPP